MTLRFLLHVLLQTSADDLLYTNLTQLIILSTGANLAKYPSLLSRVSGSSGGSAYDSTKSSFRHHYLLRYLYSSVVGLASWNHPVSLSDAAERTTLVPYVTHGMRMFHPCLLLPDLSHCTALAELNRLSSRFSLDTSV